MPEHLDTKLINHAALVRYALSRGLFQRLDGGGIRGAVATEALSFLPAKPADDAPVELQIWLDTEHELKNLGGRG